MQPESTLTRVNEVDLGEIGRIQESCNGGLECAVGGAVEQTVLMFITGFLGAFLVLALVHLTDASDAVEEERARATDERDGFAAFARQVAGMDPDVERPVPRRDGGVPLARVDSPRGAGLSGVEDAYRDTVMAVPHFEKEYCEAFDEHVAAEFGSDVARAIRYEEALTPQLQSVLVSKARVARDVRDDLVTTVDRERETLADADSALSDLQARLHDEAARPISDRSYDELLATWGRLDGLETECRTVLEDRQERIHAEPFNMSPSRADDPDSLQSYLYEPLPVEYPVLADGTTLLSDVQTAKGRVFGALAGGSR
jgi:hypothetical protein